MGWESGSHRNLSSDVAKTNNLFALLPDTLSKLLQRSLGLLQQSIATEENDYIRLKFSFLPSAESEMNALSILLGDHDVSSTIVSTITRVLCTNTDFHITTAVLSEKDDICLLYKMKKNNGNRRHLVSNDDDDDGDDDYDYDHDDEITTQYSTTNDTFNTNNPDDEELHKYYDKKSVVSTYTNMTEEEMTLGNETTIQSSATTGTFNTNTPDDEEVSTSSLVNYYGDKSVSTYTNMTDEEMALRSRLLLDVDSSVTMVTHRTSQSDPHLYWFEMGLEYKVLNIGERYNVLSELSLGRKSPLVIMEETAQDALHARISDGTLDLLTSEISDIEMFSVVGDEDVTFTAAEHQQEEVFNAIVYEVRPMPPIRILGIVMCMASLVFVAFVCGLGYKRLQRREKDFYVREKGGLATEEGLMEILDVGRYSAKALAIGYSGSGVLSAESKQI